VLALRYHRLGKKLSQRDLGDLAGGISQARVSNYETGRLTPSDETLARLAEVLGVSPAFTLLLPVEMHEQELGR
jgi:transcriptional regulator with XRE-family HTH domain